MEKMNDLRDLLKHEIQDLYSVEEQIIAAMPNMIEKATNPELKQSLKEHLHVTEQQKARLDLVQKAFGEPAEGEENTGLLSRLFKTKMVCKGMQGIISEGNQILSANMNSDVMDAAIIACAQKIEHYEICGYGTAKAYARELNLAEVERLLDQTLNEEYDADDRLTALAVGRLNQRAEKGSAGGGSTARRSTATAGSGNTRSGGARVAQPEMEMEMASNKAVGAAGRPSSASKGTSAPKGSAGGRTASGTSRAASKTSGSRSTGGSTGAGASRGASKSGTTSRGSSKAR
jgi:ferritin-like metal-binding protein YciE